MSDLLDDEFLSSDFGGEFTRPASSGSVAATGQILADANLDDGDTITVGMITYTMRVVVVDPATEIAIDVGHGSDATADNIVAQINKDTLLTECAANPVYGQPNLAIVLTANTPGAAGNAIPLAAVTMSLHGLRVTPFAGGSD